MKKTVCDICQKTIVEKEELSFLIKEQKFRFAILQIKTSNGVRWKEADICLKCLKKYLNKLVIDKIQRPKICLNCINNKNKATRYCRIGLLKEKKSFVCKYKKCE